MNRKEVLELAESILNEARVHNKTETGEKLAKCCSEAFYIGFEQVAKTNITQSQLRSIMIEPVCSMRNGYFPAVWAAYSAGRFANENGDK